MGTAIMFTSNDDLLITRHNHVEVPPSTSTVGILAARDGRLLRRYTMKETLVTSMAFSPDGRMLATGLFSGDILLWETGLDVAADSE